MDRSDSGLSAIQKACLVLRELSTPGSHRLSTIVANTGINKTTVIRVLDTLVQQGFVHRDLESKRYELGTEAMVMSAVSTSARRLVEMSRASLARLAAASGDAACLIVATGREWVCVARHEGSFAMPAHFVQVGRRLPLCMGSAGLALLAARSPEEVEHYLEGCTPELECNQRVTLDEVRNTLDLARKRGYATSTNVIWEGTGGISAVVPERGAQPYAALSITAMAPRILKRREMLGRLLLDEAARLRKAIDMNSPPGGMADLAADATSRLSADARNDLACRAVGASGVLCAEATSMPGAAFAHAARLMSYGSAHVAA